MAKLPRISIVIPSLNKGKYIEETLKSIVVQKYPNLEVIIKDGGSIDGSLEIIKKYSKKYGWIKYESKKDKGQTDAINKGFSEATGEILAYINADDVYSNGALISVGKRFSEKPRPGWLAGKGNVIDGKGEEIAKFVTLYKNLLLKLNRYSFLLMVNYLIQPSVFLSKDYYDKYGPFKGWKWSIVEYELWLRIGKKSMPVVINRNLSKFRIEKNTISSTQFKTVLAKDYEVASVFTSNPVVLLIHRLQNFGRVLVIHLVKNR